MANDCDYGLMVWDTKSTGTLSNAIEFLKIKEVSDLEKLISYMSESAKSKAESKLGLSNTIEAFKNEQVTLY